MTKPQLIDWLEGETGQQLDLVAAPAKSRHVSIRVPVELFALLEAEAAARGETVSESTRRLLEDGLVRRPGPAVAIDEAIASLQRLRSALPDVADPVGSSPADTVPP
jgi:hypothetical protein